MAAPLDGGAQYGYLVTFVLPDRLGPAAEDRNRCPGRPEPTSGTARHNLITLRRVPRAERSREQGSLCSSADERDVAVMATKAIVGEKIGMTQVWDDENRVVPVTVLRVKPCRVVKVKTDERDGYTALQVTFGTKKASKITKPKLGQFEKAGVEPGPRLVELRLDDVSEYSVGQELKADLLSNGDKVDVTAVSKGKGFAGAMKRHGFGGMPASHGTHRTHRAPGSVGRLRYALAGIQGPADGRSHGWREGHHLEPPGGDGRCRSRHRPRPRLGTRAQGWACADP